MILLLCGVHLWTLHQGQLLHEIGRLIFVHFDQELDGTAYRSGQINQLQAAVHVFELLDEGNGRRDHLVLSSLDRDDSDARLWTEFLDLQ